jgi:transposase
MEGELLMKESDRKRLYVILQVLERKLKQKEASKLLKVTIRQVKRIFRRVRKEGDAGVLHRNRGRKSNRCIAASVKEKTLKLCQERYIGFGPTLASEQLEKKEGIKISDETLRLWMKASGIVYRKRKERPHRQWRERKEHFGEMLQMDGSHHDWLEGRGPKMVMMGYIDDATGRAFARFYEYEGTLPAFDGLLRYIKKYGIPCSVYLDKHTTYKGIRPLKLIDELNGDCGESQFQRAMKEMAVEVIHANSPQAKGRIERFFRTAQDRLVKEMRIEGITDLRQANVYLTKYLSDHNRKFTYQAKKGTDVHRSVPKELDLKSILSVQTRRVLRNDSTIFYNGKIYQVIEVVRVKHLTVELRVDGTIHLSNNQRPVRFEEIDATKLPKRPIKEEGPGKGNRIRMKPADKHPWVQLGRAHYQEWVQKNKGGHF